MWGVVGAQKEAVMAARRSIVTVEEIVDDLHAPPNSVILPSWVVSAVSEVSEGAELFRLTRKVITPATTLSTSCGTTLRRNAGSFSNGLMTT